MPTQMCIEVYIQISKSRLHSKTVGKHQSPYFLTLKSKHLLNGFSLPGIILVTQDVLT